MHLLVLLLFGFIAFFWVFHGLRVAWGLLRLPWLKDFAPLADTDCPRITLIFAARDEEEKLPAALATLAAIDYPHLEIIAVDDRSADATGRILEEFALTGLKTGHYNGLGDGGDMGIGLAGLKTGAYTGAGAGAGTGAYIGGGERRAERFRVVHVRELPAGWLGKPHALQKAYESSTGEWLLFTDADVRFAPDALRRAMAVVQSKKLDHLTLFGDVEMVGFWETVVLTFFGLAMHVANDPYRVSNPHSRAYMGVGAFQLIKRSAYEASGTHRRLAMEVVDDMKLGKLVKQAGLRSGVGIAQEAVVVRWHAGVGNLIRGVTKNFFAALDYNLTFVTAAICGMLLTNVAPFVGLVFGHGWVWIFSGVAVVIALGFHVGVDLVMRVSPFYALTHPLGAVLFSYMLLRSTVVTLWQGGVTWRGTFYPLKELRRGVV
jgi:glycosyltransferase involved in cell wall biosynthesis